MNKLRTLIYGVLDGLEERVLDFLAGIEGVTQVAINSILDAVGTAVHQVVRIVFGLAETAVEESFLLAETVVELVIGKRDASFPTGEVLCGSSLPDWEELGSIGGSFDLDDLGQTPTVTEEEDN